MERSTAATQAARSAPVAVLKQGQAVGAHKALVLPVSPAITGNILGITWVTRGAKPKSLSEQIPGAAPPTF
jgi:hypothetical protein